MFTPPATPGLASQPRKGIWCARRRWFQAVGCRVAQCRCRRPAAVHDLARIEIPPRMPTGRSLPDTPVRHAGRAGPGRACWHGCSAAAARRRPCRSNSARTGRFRFQRGGVSRAQPGGARLLQHAARGMRSRNAGHRARGARGANYRGDGTARGRAERAGRVPRVEQQAGGGVGRGGTCPANRCAGGGCRTGGSGRHCRDRPASSLRRRIWPPAPGASLRRSTRRQPRPSSPARRRGGTQPRRGPTRLTLHRAPRPWPAPRPIRPPRRRRAAGIRRCGQRHARKNARVPNRSRVPPRYARRRLLATGRGSQREASYCHGGTFYSATDM